ncbi:MAG: GDSL-type esterase/lipase family protein [Verrucomicrobiales bacterium]|jgi:lysophospholipase L1-like esterase|nr:GDSL-type esterase/lipase family protein [Verrucomicrobiales bacterium]
MLKKIMSLFALVLLAGFNAGAVEDNLNVWPMPATLPTAPPAGVARTVFPMPRVEWLGRVQIAIADSAKQGAAVQLVFDGDSITDGWHGNGRKVWEDHYARYGAYNFGIGGDRTETILWRLAQGQAAGLQPKLVAIMIGTNNLGGNSDEDIAAGVTAVVNKYREVTPGAVILVQGIFPRSALATDPVRARIKNINTLLAKLDDGQRVIFIDFGDKFLQPDGNLSKDIMPDFLHLSPAGYQIWADAIRPVIEKYLE